MLLLPHITEEIDPDFDDSYKNGAHALFGSENPTKRRPNEWGSISSWAWGLSRCMDYLESEPIIDSNRIAVMGHSRLGEDCSLGRGCRSKICNDYL